MPQMMKKHLRLSHVEEIELCKLAQNGCTKSMERMVTHNLGLVNNITKKLYYKNEQYSYDDMFQEGVIGLMKAINKFNPKEGCRFSTYSYYWIYCFISRYHVNNNGKIRFPSHIQDKLRSLDVIESDKLKSKLPYVISLNTIIGENSTLEDLVSDNNYKEFDCEMEVILDQMLNVLSEREYDVICYRYGLSGKPPMSQRECAKIYNVSYTMIYFIEKKAISKLRQHFN